MRVSKFFLSTLKEAPSEAELVSHRLMLRAGLIRRLGSGIYSLMPMGLRIARKVEAIVRDFGDVLTRSGTTAAFARSGLHPGDVLQIVSNVGVDGVTAHQTMSIGLAIGVQLGRLTPSAD